jgi:Fe-Mn family superoxide dismutase
LPYGYEALEPYIDARTLMLHHDKHHASYISNLNSALEPFPKLHERNALWLLLNPDKIPRKILNSVRNNAGGHVNHSLFWRAMSATGGGAPADPLAAAIDRDFGGLEQFKVQFAEAGNAMLGSGWVWLANALHNGGGLKIYVTSGHDNPMIHRHFPILVNDIWEHAYYLKYENRRADYLQAWWSVVDWLEASRRFELSDRSAEQRRKDEGGNVFWAWK